MNTAKILELDDTGMEHIALELEGGDDESRIRRAMRVNPALWARKTGRTPSRRLVGGVALVASGFCLGDSGTTNEVPDREAIRRR